jgi:hypothetical protein
MMVLIVAVLGACRPATVEDGDTGPTQEQMKRAESAADALVKELSEQLVAELERSGPVGAIEVCSVVAQKIAHDHSRDGLLVRRVSLRLRNPANQASGWAERHLELWEREVARGKTPRAAWADAEGTGYDGSRSRELWYLRPLIVAPPCLNCHGSVEEMNPTVVDRLAELYPKDAAVGYTVGDLRGAVSVRLGLDGQQVLPIIGPGQMRSRSHVRTRDAEG